jgi:hypothetical protein
MTKHLRLEFELFAEFEDSQVSNLSSICGGTGDPVEHTTTKGYDTTSSATDFDCGDHDCDP